MPTSGRLALDIETISPGFDPDDEVDFENPEHFELAAIGFAYEGPGAGSHIPRTQVLFRRAPGTQGEIEFIRRLKSELWTISPAEIVTFAGNFFDLPMLKQRPAYANESPVGDGGAEDMRAVLSNAESIDIGDDAAEAYGYGTGLDDLIEAEDGVTLRKTAFSDYDHGLDLDRVRPSNPDSGNLDSDDIPGVMETWLHARSETHDDIGTCNIDETQAMLEDYVLGDIEHLLTLADQRPF